MRLTVSTTSRISSLDLISIDWLRSPIDTALARPAILARPLLTVSEIQNAVATDRARTRIAAPISRLRAPAYWASVSESTLARALSVMSVMASRDFLISATAALLLPADRAAA